MGPCRVVRAPQGSAVFDAISEEQVTGRVVDRMVPPRGYNSAATSGLVAFEAEGAQQQLPFGLADLQVCLYLYLCLSVCLVLLPCFRLLFVPLLCFAVFCLASLSLAWFSLACLGLALLCCSLLLNAFSFVGHIGPMPACMLD